MAQVADRLVHEDFQACAVYDFSGRNLWNVVRVDDLRIQVGFLKVEADERDERANQNGVAAESGHRGTASQVARGRRQDGGGHLTMDAPARQRHVACMKEHPHVDGSLGVDGKLRVE